MKKLAILLGLSLSLSAFANTPTFNVERYNSDVQHYEKYKEDAFKMIVFLSVFNTDKGVQEAVVAREHGDFNKSKQLVAHLKEARVIADNIGYPAMGWFGDCQKAANYANVLWGYAVAGNNAENDPRYSPLEKEIKEYYMNCKRAYNKAPDPKNDRYSY